MATQQKFAVDVSAMESLLLDVCEELQLEDSQYERAEGHYRAVGEFLGEKSGPFAALRPDIYPQGSVALQTAIKPVRDCEFDVDLVYEVNAGTLSPRDLYERIYDRLTSSGTYRKMVERKERCVRLNYAGEFHMDVLPAVRVSTGSDGSVLIVDPASPSRTGQSNPRGYQQWFRARTAGLTLEAVRKMAALPNNPDARERSVLGRTVQLIKRRRAIRYGDSDLAPRSVILTTLAAQLYAAESNVFEALAAVVRGINDQIHAAAPGRITVVNPTNPEEHFTDRFTDASYASFAAFFRDLDREVTAIGGLVMPQLGKDLAAMFGERETYEALRKRDARDIGTPRAQGLLRVAAQSGAVRLVTPTPHSAGSVGRPVRNNTFFGS